MKAVPASRYLVFFTVGLGGCLIDLLTKHWMFRSLGMPGGPTRWVVKDVVGFQTVLNEGALFGLGQGMATAFAVLAVVAAMCLLFWLFVAGAARDGWLNFSLACITAGILGNLYDRLGLPGLRWNFANALHQVGDPVYAVRDWILVMIGRHPWPNFNIADSLLVCGAILLVGQAFRRGNP